MNETLTALQEENAELAARVQDASELEDKVAQLERRNEVISFIMSINLYKSHSPQQMLEAQNAETLSLLDDVRATATTLGDAMAGMANSGGSAVSSSLADELGARNKCVDRRSFSLCLI